MSTAARKRLIRDFKRLQQDPPEGVNASPQAENIMTWNAIIFGPDETIWDGGVFKLSMEFSEDYPNKAPVVKFRTQLFHPNSKPVQAISSSTSVSEHPCYVSSQWCCPLPATTPVHAVYADGAICLDILQNQWSPIYDVSAILTSIQSLLSDPNPNSPANSEVSNPTGQLAIVTAAAAQECWCKDCWQGRRRWLLLRWTPADIGCDVIHTR